MSNLLIGISGMAAVIAGLIAIFDTQSIWFWIFVVLSIPFGMLICGIIFTAIGESLLRIVATLDYYDEDSEDE